MATPSPFLFTAASVIKLKFEGIDSFLHCCLSLAKFQNNHMTSKLCLILKFACQRPDVKSIFYQFILQLKGFCETTEDRP